MDILDQKLGNVGDVHVSLVAGKLIIGVDADVDVVAQLEKLKAAHSTGVLGAILSAAEAAINAASPAAPAATPSA